MSIESSIVRCSQCAYEHRLDHIPIVCRYHLDDGTVFEHTRQLGWCYDCESISDLEDIDEMRDLEALQAKIKRMDEQGWSTETAIQKLLAGHQAFKNRSSSSRCLSCGSTHISRGIEGLTHSCGGVLHIDKVSTGPRFSFPTITIELDNEGQQSRLHRAR